MSDENISELLLKAIQELIKSSPGYYTLKSYRFDVNEDGIKFEIKIDGGE